MEENIDTAFANQLGRTNVEGKRLNYATFLSIPCLQRLIIPSIAL